MRRIIAPLILFSITVLILMVPQAMASEDTVQMTEEELAFIKKHPVVTIGVDPEFVPLEFFSEDGEFKGLVADVLEIVSERTGLEFVAESRLLWPEAYELALDHKIDALPAVGVTKTRMNHFLYSKPYYYYQRVIVVNKDNDDITDIQDLKDMTVAVQRNSSHHSYLLEHADVNLSLYDSKESGLVAVATGEEKAYIGNLSSANYLIGENGIDNLKLISYEAEEKQALHFVADKAYPELISIFNKAVDSISESEWNTIKNRWMETGINQGFEKIVRIAVIIGVFLSIILGVSVIWNMRLRKEIKRRHRAELSLIRAKEKVEKINSQLSEANEKLAQLSIIDSLTGIYNRRYLDEYAERVWSNNDAHAFPLSLIMLDLDNFKAYNDTYGHLAGDKCLQLVSQKIQTNMLGQSGFLARYGGEEFIIMLFNSNRSEAASLAEEIRNTIASTEIYQGMKKTKVTISIGIATAKDISKDYQSLIHHADDALYTAKKEGRNRVVV